jgi:serine phosphatase RsbU (regulator of sigma subunit)
VCSLAAIALDNAVLVKNMVEGERLRQELDLARGVQAGMFPGSDLTVGTLVLAGGARPCSETGGDYYTWLTCDGRVRTMISDVSGHGLGAALYTTMAHVLAQQQLRSGAGLEAAVKVLNDGLFHAHSGRFMTAALVDIDPATGAMNYTSAGHNPLLWINQGEVRWLDSSGMPIGVMDEGTWPEGGPLQLAPGDLLMLYTDGFTEAVDATSDAWGDDRFAATVLAAWRSGSNPAEISTLVHAAVDAWVGSSTHLDDLTMVVMHWAGPSTMPV